MNFYELKDSYNNSKSEPFCSSENEFDETRERLEAFSIYIDDFVNDLGDYTPRTLSQVTLPFSEDTFNRIIKLSQQDRETLREFSIISIGRAWSECSSDSSFPEESAEFLSQIFFKVFEQEGHRGGHLGDVLDQIARNKALLNLTSKFLNYFLQLNSKPQTNIKKLRSLTNKLPLTSRGFADFDPSSFAFNVLLSHLTNPNLSVSSETLNPYIESFFHKLSPRGRIKEWEEFLCSFNEGGYYATCLILHPCAVPIDLEIKTHATILQYFTLIKVLDYQALKLSFPDVVLAESLDILKEQAVEYAENEAAMRPIRKALRSSFR